MNPAVGRSPTGAGAPVLRGRPGTSLLLLVGCVVLALGAGLTAAELSGPDRLSARSAPGSPFLQLPRGAVEVLAVTPELMAHTPGMPTAMMPGDPLPEDVRRVTVQLVLTAGRDGLPFAGGDFRLGAPGEVESAPERDGVGEGLLPADYRMDGELVFRVPESADTLVLTEVRSGRTLDVAVAEGPTPAHAHPGAEPSPATPTAPAQQHDPEHDHEDTGEPAAPQPGGVAAVGSRGPAR